MAALKWERVKSQKPDGCDNAPDVIRAAVPGGWLVLAGFYSDSGLTFYSDPDHKWEVDHA